MTGRYAARTGLSEAKATIAGEGLSGREVTLAELLSQSNDGGGSSNGGDDDVQERRRMEADG